MIGHDDGSRSRGPEFKIDRDLVATVDADGYFMSLNTAWERLLGWTRRELMARPLIEFVHLEDRERTAEESRKVDLPDYEVVDFENRYLTKDGGFRWLRWSARSDGHTWFTVAFDITDQKAAEARLRALLTSENLLA